MNEFEKQAKERKINKLYLSVKKDNLRAIEAYRRIGWNLYKENQNSLEMQKELEPL
jgi:ribosomal protein S18 acetylase RimI-like enzyme